MSSSPPTKEIVVLAIDVEKAGAALDDPLFAVGAAVLSMEGKVLDSYLGYNYDPAYVVFEPRCWAFWGQEAQAPILKSLERKATSKGDYHAAQYAMMKGLFEFIAKWQANKAYGVWIVTDTCGFDHEAINHELLKTGLNRSFMPLPYWNGDCREWTSEDSNALPPSDGIHLRGQTVTAPFGMMRSTTSMIHGFLLGRGILKHDQVVFSMKKALRKAFPDLPDSPAEHTHDPRDDAIEIAFLLIQVFRLTC